LITATVGQAIEHQVTARAGQGQGQVRFELADGPDGLMLRPEGKLTSTVPASLAGDDVTADSFRGIEASGKGPGRLRD
jgi:hypothetical protein